MKKALVVTTIKVTFKAFLIPHIKQLEKMGYEVELACNTGDNLKIEELEGNKWHHISFGRNPFSLNSFKAIRELRKIKKDNGYDLVHLHTPVAAFLGRFSAWTVGVKKIFYTAHGFHFFRGSSLISWMIYYPMEWIAMRWTDKVITMNQEDYERAQKMAGRRTKVYKVDGVGLELKKYSQGDREKVRKELGISEKDFIVTIIGELNENKNQIQLIRAIEGLESKFKALIVGVGPKEKELKGYVKTKKLENKIKFLGFRKDINDVVAGSEVLASMSYREGLPRNIMEGLAQGKPFIATDIRGNRDIIEDKINGYLIPVGDYKVTAEKLMTLNETKIYDQVKKSNLKHVEKYSIEQILKEMGAIQEETNESSLGKS